MILRNDIVVSEGGNSRIRACNLNGSVSFNSPNIVASFNPDISNFKYMEKVEDTFIVGINNEPIKAFSVTAEKYFLPDDLQYDRTDFNSFDYRLWQAVAHAGLCTDEKEIVIGMSIVQKELKNFYKRTEKYLKNVHLTYYNFDGSIRFKKHFKRIRFVPIIQGYTSLIKHCSDNKDKDYSDKYIVIIDLGSKTCLCIKAKGLTPLLDDSLSTEHGSKAIYKKVRAELHKEGFDKSLWEIEQLHIGGRKELKSFSGSTVNIENIFLKAMKEYFIKIRDLISSHVDNQTPDLYLITGGTSLLLRKYAPDLFKVPVEYVKSPKMANYIGAKIYMKAIME